MRELKGTPSRGDRAEGPEGPRQLEQEGLERAAQSKNPKSRLAPDVKSSAAFWTEPACEVNYSRVWKSHLKGLDRTASGAHTELGIVPALTSELGKRDSELRMEHTVLLQ